MNNVNHNFLPFEVTELLPKENPYTSTFAYVLYDFSETIFFENKAKLKEGSFVKLCDAWTIIDALTWLEETHCRYVEVMRGRHGKFIVSIIDNSGNVVDELSNNYKSCIEAYTAGIKYCLELLNSTKNGNVN